MLLGKMVMLSFDVFLELVQWCQNKAPFKNYLDTALINISSYTHIIIYLDLSMVSMHKSVNVCTFEEATAV